MSKNLEKRVASILWSTVLVVVFASAVWMGIGIGRSGEKQRMQQLMAMQAENDGTTNVDMEEYAREMAALEAQLAANDKMLQTIAYVRNYYVDPVLLDTIYEKAIPALLSELDPHSEYIPAKMFSEVNESLEGEFDGIGIVFNASTDTITVLSVIPNGPSSAAGVRPGDRIVKIDGRSVAGQKIGQDSMVKLMRGKRGTRVKLGVKRASLKELVNIEVTRAPIEIHSIETAFMLNEESKIGFVRLSQFARTSYSEMHSAIERLNAEGMRGLIIDLRGNGGGFLDQAILIANEFLPENSLIVYTEDRFGQQIKEYSRGNGNSAELEIAILVDETSASSSEILAGAIQDNDRGVIIGRRTFGKGLVQSQIPFNDGSAIRLTVARYYTPSGRSIQRPYTNGDDMAYHMDLIDRYNRNEFFSADSIHFDKSQTFKTKGGRTVYGGGGIMPDVFIPLDTLGMSDYYYKVWNTNVLYRYTVDFTDRHRAEMDKIATLAELDALLSRSNLLANFVAYAERNGVAKDEAGLALSREVIEAQLRAYIGRNALHDDAGFYYNIYPIDKTMQSAVKELRTRLNKSNNKR
ncbi:MAG: S41 family peptidase [Alistipes sp.]|nr:S41 family peptidase [Alistipes sp.]